MKARLNAHQTCVMTLLCLSRYCKEKDKKISRIRLSENSLKKLSGRQRLRTEFLEELEEYFLDWGWCLIKTPTYYGLIKIEAIDGWTQIATKRVARDLQRCQAGAATTKDFENFEQEIEEMFPS